MRARKEFLQWDLDREGEQKTLPELTQPTEIDDLKRSLLRSLTGEQYLHSFDMTKLAILGDFFQPNAISTRRFVEESRIVALAAELNKAYYQHMMKRRRIEEVGIHHPARLEAQTGRKNLPEA